MARSSAAMPHHSNPAPPPPLVVTLNCIEDCSLEQESLADVASVEHVPLSRLASSDKTIESASAVLLHSLAYLPRAAQRRLRPYQLVLCLGSSDRAVDSALAADLGLRLVHVDVSRAEEIADTVMALILGLLRRTHLLSRHTLSASGWLGSVQPLCRGMRRCRGMVLGVIGRSASAISLANRSLAFKMSVLYFDVLDGNGKVTRSSISFPASARRMETLNDLLAASDIISLHCGLTNETIQILNAECLQHIKPGAFLVNTGSSQLVDDCAVKQLLIDGTLAGCALDGAEGPQWMEAWVREMPNVLILPRSADYSEEVWMEMREKAISILQTYFFDRIVPTDAVSDEEAEFSEIAHENERSIKVWILGTMQLADLKSFHVRLMSIVLDVDVEPSTTPWDPAKAYLFVPVVGDDSIDPSKKIDWNIVETILQKDAWSNPLQRARPDVYLGTNERTLGGDRREYGFGKLRHGMAFGNKSHPTYGIRGAVAQFDVVRASGLIPHRDALELNHHDLTQQRLVMANSLMSSEDLVGRIVTAAHSGKRFYVDSVCYDMNANKSFPRKEGYLGPLEYSSYADYYRQKYGVDLIHKEQPLIRGRGVSYCKNFLSPRFEHSESEPDETLDKTYYVFLPPELCLVHPLPGSLVRGAQRLPSIMRRVESMLLAIQLKGVINYPVPALRILEALTAASCQETFCYERAELLGDAYLKWVVSRFLFLKYPQKHEGQLTRMRQQMVSNMVLYEYALTKGLQSYIQADRFAPSRWAAPGVLPVFDEDTKDEESPFFDDENSTVKGDHGRESHGYADDDDEMEDGELESDSSSYRVLSSKTLADVVEALIGVYYVDGGKKAANHLMKWVGIQVEFDNVEIEHAIKPSNVPESILRSIDFVTLESALGIKFRDRGLLVEAITHASRPSSGVACYQRLEFVGDAVLDHLITRHLFFTYTDLPPGRLTDLRAAAVNNENFARVAVKHKLHLHLRHGSSALERQIRDFVKEVQEELLKPGFNSFGLGDCKAPKVLGDIVESIAGAIFLDSERDTSVVWKVFQPLLQPMVTPETLPMHPVRELQERCQQQAEGLEYKACRSGNLATVEVFIDGVQIGVAQNPQKKMAQKLAARNALALLKERETTSAKEKSENGDGKMKNGSSTFTRQTLNDICLRRNWPMPFYRCVNEGGPAHAKRFTYAVRVNTTDKGWTDECVGEPMPSVKKAKDSAAVLLLELLNKWYAP